MPVTGSTIRVQGLRELQTAFARIDADMAKNLRKELRGAAEPVKVDAQVMAIGRIRNVGTPWSRMRIGVTRSSVYVAPQQRGAKGRGNQRLRRRNMFNLLLNRSLLPALQKNESGVLGRVENLLGRMASEWGRGG